MKKFTKFLNEGVYGNEFIGVTNHYTPVQNILTFINNVFCSRLSIVASEGEDGVSIKLTSSKFTSAKAIDEYLYMQLNTVANNYNEASLYSYITSCGLSKVTKIDLGGYWIVYFSPADIKTAEDPCAMCCKDCCPCPCEANESLLNEFEIESIIKEDDEEEMKSQTVEKVLELLDGPDKVKAAKQLELLITNEIHLPREFYFAAVKFKSGEEAIALRWRYTKKMPFGKGDGDEGFKEISIENTRSIMHIFGKGDQAIWVQDYDKEALVKLPDDVKKLIDDILDILEADKTDNPAVFKLTGERKEREDKDEDKDKDEEKDKDENSEEGGENKDENSEEGGEDKNKDKDEDSADEDDDLL